MTQDEIAVIDGGKCIKFLSDADPKNAFDMEKHIKRLPSLVKPDEGFDVYEVDGEGLQLRSERPGMRYAPLAAWKYG